MTPQEAAALYPGDPVAQANALAQDQALARQKAENDALAEKNFREQEAELARKEGAAPPAVTSGPAPAPILSTPGPADENQQALERAGYGSPTGAPQSWAAPQAPVRPSEQGQASAPAPVPRLVATPQAAGAQAPAGPTGRGLPTADGLANLAMPARQTYADALDMAARLEMAKRATPGRRVAAHTQETSSTIQRALGPTDDTIAALEAERANQTQIAGELAAVENNRRSLLADVASQREQAVDAERQAALAAAEQRKAKLGEISASYDAKLQELRASEGKIDPGKFWSSKSDWQKLGLALATAFGALGQGLMRSSTNVGLEAVKQGIADEVERQREAVLEGRKNLSLIGEVYQRTRAELGDDELARQAAYKAGLDVLDARGAAISARANAALTTRPKQRAPGAEESAAPGAEQAAPVPAVSPEQAQTTGALAGAAASPLASAVGSAIAGPVLGPLAGLATSVGGGAIADRLRAAWDARQAAKATEARPEATVAAKPREPETETETVSLHQLKAESDARLAAMAQRADLESQMRGTKTQGYQFVPEKIVGGSAGPDIAKLLKYRKEAADLEGDTTKQRGDITKILGENAAASAKGGPPVISIGGQLFEADKRIPHELVVDAEKRAKIGSNITRDVAELEARSRTAGGIVPGDPTVQVLAGQLAGAFSNRSGSGAPSESEAKLIKEAVTPGPRQAEALKTLMAIGRFEQADAVRRIGGRPVR